MIRIYNKDSKLTNSPTVVGDSNTVVINSTKNEDIDWEVLQDELIRVSGKLPKNSIEYNMTKNALVYAMTKNKNGLIEFLKNNWTQFLTDIFTGAASGILVEILKSLVRIAV